LFVTEAIQPIDIMWNDIAVRDDTVSRLTAAVGSVVSPLLVVSVEAALKSSDEYRFSRSFVMSILYHATIAAFASVYLRR
jgi:hypothetical protein